MKISSRAAVALASLLALGCDDNPPSAPAALENTDALCADGVDNDGDALIDCADPDCLPLPVCADSDTGSDGPTETWTIMMYEDADNNLEEVLLQDINEAEAADIPAGVNIIVLVDRVEGYTTADGDWTGAKLFRLEHDDDPGAINSPRLADPDYLGLTDDSANGEEIDMGARETLEGFIDYCQAAFPADHYILHISDHGDGWKKAPTAAAPSRGMCSDETSGSQLSMATDFPQAIAGKGLEAISLDACLLATVEVAWAAKGSADFLAASVMSVPGTGWEYTSTLNGWFAEPTAERWVANAVEAYEEYYGGQSQVGFSAIDLRPLAEFGDALDAFLDAAAAASVEELKAAKEDAAKPQWMGWDGMVDFRDFVGRCAEPVGEEVTAELLLAFDGLIVDYWYSDDLSEIGALSVYAPTVVFGFGEYDPAYDTTPFALETDWEDFIIPLN